MWFVFLQFDETLLEAVAGSGCVSCYLCLSGAADTEDCDTRGKKTHNNYRIVSGLWHGLCDVSPRYSVPRDSV